MRYSKRVFEGINKLLVKNYDAEKEYINSFENIKNEKLKNIFKEKAEEKRIFAKELREDILLHAKSCYETISFKDVIFRDWGNLKRLLLLNNEHGILEELIKVERESLKEYDAVIDINEFEPATLQLLEKQRQQIQLSINSIKVSEKLTH